jgi:hypothetical protein
MNTIQKFFQAHSISSHSFVGLYATFTAFLAADRAARTAVFAFFDKHPLYSLAFAFAGFAYARYSGSHSDSGVMDQADKIWLKEKPLTASEKGQIL